jgi:diguanylate cyclase (GGDEF)-like protein
MRESELSVLLIGEAQVRPAGLEVALARAGFHVTEADDVGVAAANGAAPDVVLATLRNAGDVAALTELLGYALGPAMPLVVTLGSEAEDATLTALRAGATDAMVAPVNLAELCLRLQLRRGIRTRTPQAAAGLDQSLRFASDLVSSRRMEEVLQQLCRRVADALALERCAFVLTTGDNGHGRVIADDGHAGLLDLDLDLERYPEIQEARRTGQLVVVRDTRTDPRFDAVRRNWAISPPASVPQSLVTVPVRLDGRVAGVFLLRHHAQRGLASGALTYASELEQAGTAALLAGRDHADHGTGSLATARELERRMLEEVGRARRYSLGFSLVLLELDSLDVFSATRGQVAADRLLDQVADLLREAFRAPDLVARYGADEFALLLPETAAAQALGAVRRFRIRLAEEPFDGFDQDSGPTVAAGIAGFPHPAAADAGDVMALAGAALLRARAQSGERIGVAEIGAM